MKILAVVESKHLGNTLKIAKAMSEETDMTIVNVNEAKNYDLNDFDIIGLGSGIYFGRHDKRLMEFAENLDDKKSYTFVFSTSGAPLFLKNNSALVEVLKKKNKVVLGSFGCKAHDKYSVFKLIGGINKGRPNNKDFEQARKFILDVIKNYKISEGI